MSQAAQALWFNAVPLLVLAAACALVTAAMLGRSRAPRRAADLALAAAFAAVAVLAAVEAALVLADRRPLGDHVWVAFAATLVALVPVLAVAWRSLAHGAISAVSVPR